MNELKAVQIQLAENKKKYAELEQLADTENEVMINKVKTNDQNYRAEISKLNTEINRLNALQRESSVRPSAIPANFDAALNMIIQHHVEKSTSEQTENENRIYQEAMGVDLEEEFTRFVHQLDEEKKSEEQKKKMTAQEKKHREAAAAANERKRRAEEEEELKVQRHREAANERKRRAEEEEAERIREAAHEKRSQEDAAAYEKAKAALEESVEAAVESAAEKSRLAEAENEKKRKERETSEAKAEVERLRKEREAAEATLQREQEESEAAEKEKTYLTDLIAAHKDFFKRHQNFFLENKKYFQENPDVLVDILENERFPANTSYITKLFSREPKFPSAENPPPPSYSSPPPPPQPQPPPFGEEFWNQYRTHAEPQPQPPPPHPSSYGPFGPPPRSNQPPPPKPPPYKSPFTTTTKSRPPPPPPQETSFEEEMRRSHERIFGPPRPFNYARAKSRPPPPPGSPLPTYGSMHPKRPPPPEPENQGRRSTRQSSHWLIGKLNKLEPISSQYPKYYYRRDFPLEDFLEIIMVNHGDLAQVTVPETRDFFKKDEKLTQREIDKLKKRIQFLKANPGTIYTQTMKITSAGVEHEPNKGEKEDFRLRYGITLVDYKSLLDTISLRHISRPGYAYPPNVTAQKKILEMLEARIKKRLIYFASDF
jgi:hypothetical protein